MILNLFGGDKYPRQLPAHSLRKCQLRQSLALPNIKHQGSLADSDPAVHRYPVNPLYVKHHAWILRPNLIPSMCSSGAGGVCALTLQA